MTYLKLCTAAFIGLAAPAFAVPIDILALYTFDNGITVDDSGNGNTGTVLGGVSIAAGGGRDGSDALDMSVVAGLSGIDTGIDINRGSLASLTMGGWVYTRSTGGRGLGKILSHDNGGFDRTLGVDSRGDDPGNDYAAFTGAGVADADATALALNVWTHLAVVYDGAASALYVNGVVVDTFTESTELVDSGWTLHIGTNPSFNEDFDGLADDLFVYGRALSANEIGDIYSNGFGETPAAVPLPAALPLLLAGLGGLGALRTRARRG